MIFTPQIKHPPSHTSRYLLIAVVSSLATYAIMGKAPVRASSAQETHVVIPCDTDTIIEAHYIGVLDKMDMDYNPVWAVPARKPDGNRELPMNITDAG